jgi:hypothetical protein
MKMIAAASGLALLLAAGAGLAQGVAPQKPPQAGALPDWRAQPRYTTLNLRAGFEPDPQEVPVEAGGNRDAGPVGPDCAGWIDFERPDVDLNYTAGTFPLIISAESEVDTTIVINDPAGRWLCNDDLDGLNPGVVFERPQSGNYNIWVGTFDRGQPRAATVRVSEVLPRAPR